MRKTTIIVIGILFAFMLGIIFINSRDYDFHEGALIATTTYLFDPITILPSLDSSKSDIFYPAPAEPSEGWSLITHADTYRWTQDDYFKVANALHEYIWDETLFDWHLIYGSFTINQCVDIFGNIDTASLSYFRKKDGAESVHGFWIDPSRGLITAGNGYSMDKGKIININKMVVKDLDSALLISENVGGVNAREILKDRGCYISALFAPYVLQAPFNTYDWGWRIYYGQVFGVEIDPYTSEYNVLKQR